MATEVWWSNADEQFLVPVAVELRVGLKLDA